MKYPVLTSLLLATLLCPASLLAADPLSAAMEVIEREQMRRLARQQRIPGITIDRFHSDGCSGGMSDAWTYLAAIWPEFAESVGDRPPWEYCCTEHDKSYWRGSTENGFEQRRQADQQLRACVLDAGQMQAAEMSRNLGLPREEIIALFELAGETMYQAVRIGGGPCTGLPWRWGHGWPACLTDLGMVQLD